MTSKDRPGDFDACWDVIDVDVERLDPALLNFSSGRATQEPRLGGELPAAQLPNGQSARTFLEFFQIDKQTGDPCYGSPKVAAVIKNERQYRITRVQAEKFEHAIAELVSASDTLGVHPVLKKAEIDALKSQLGDLEAELEEYQALRSGKRQALTLDSFDDLPRALVQGRIAAGLSQQELAARLGIKEQQVQRYEASDYQSASLARVAEVVRALGLRIQTDLFLPSGIAGQVCGALK